MNSDLTDDRAARALLQVLGSCRWEVVALARVFLELPKSADDEAHARSIYDHTRRSLGESRELVAAMRKRGFLVSLPVRKKTGSAENPITKLFPATITEQRFVEEIERLRQAAPGLAHEDNRHGEHTLVDFTFRQSGVELPINIKNAGTRFERARDLVGLDPDDCVPVPAYKATAAVDAQPNLLYVVSIDYELVGRLAEHLPRILTPDERVVWDVLMSSQGAYLKEAEDQFVFGAVRRHWSEILPIAGSARFRAISARKATRILHTLPRRTPGIGLRAWGTGASAEINVHVSVADDMTPWENVAERIVTQGLGSVVAAVNRKRVEEVYDPEI